MKTYTIRLFPDSTQVKQLEELSYQRNLLWNLLIDMEQTEYETNKKIIHNYGLDKEITKLRKTTDISKLNSKACQRVSKEVYSSYQSFFKLIKKDKCARPPKKINDVNHFHTLVFNQTGWVVKDDIITINKIPLKYKTHLASLSDLNIKEIKVKYVNRKWLCDITYSEDIEYKDTLEQNNKVLAIDLGLKNLGTGVDTKENVIVLKNKSKKINKYYQKQIANVQSKLSKKQKGSRKHKKLRKTLNKLYKKKNTQIKQTLHTQSKELLSMNYHTIVLGKLTVKKLMEDEKNKYTKITKSFHQSNINMFLGMLKYKAYQYSTNVLEIDERHTTQTNSLTGKLFKDKVGLKDRTVMLNDDIEIDRDLNSAINILERYFNNHLAAMTQPLVKANVIHKNNLMNKTLKQETHVL
jgi:putative transposase